VRNVDVCHITKNTSLSPTIKSPRLSLFGHVAHMAGKHVYITLH